jgi:plasmid stabilization system protein ParE
VKYKISEEATLDLKLIYLYSLKEFGENKADEYIESLFNVFDMIGNNNEIGLTPDFKTKSNVRKFPALKHVVYYSIDANFPNIRRIFHSSKEINDSEIRPFQ